MTCDGMMAMTWDTLNSSQQTAFRTEIRTSNTITKFGSTDARFEVIFLDYQGVTVISDDNK